MLRAYLTYRKIAACSHLSTVTVVSAGLERVICEDCGDVNIRYESMISGDVDRSKFSRDADAAIYLSLFVQGKGALRRELTECLRTGRAYRHPKTKRAPSGKGQIVDPVLISERPAEVEDRAVPGHWEGDLLMGKRQTAIGTLMERHTRYVMLFPLPDGNTAEAVRDALTETVRRLPDHLWQSLTWDQGKEMAQHAQFSIDTGVDVYFCDPKSSWQRGTNKNTNGLLRQLPQRHRYVQAHPSRPRRGRPLPQRPASTDPRLDDTIRKTRRSVAMTP